MNTWVMKDVKPAKPGWYFTWRERYPDEVWPLMFDGKNWDNETGIDDMDNFDMWCHQPAVPDVESFHKLRAMINAKKN